MKSFQFHLFKRIFARKNYRTRLAIPMEQYPTFPRIRIKNKAQFITEHFIGRPHRIRVYTGRRWKRCKIDSNRVGFRFGEFVWTKRQGRRIHLTDHNKNRAEKIYKKAHGMLKKQRRTKA